MKAMHLLPIFASAALLAGPALAVDDAAAKKLFKLNDCGSCHAPDKTKKGPSLMKIAEKYKGKTAEGEQAVIKNVTTGPKVKLEDGTEDNHKIIDTKDEAQLKNLAQWILAR